MSGRIEKNPRIMTRRIQVKLTHDLFRHVLAMPMDSFDRHQSGDILSRVSNDLAAVQAAMTQLPLYLIRDSMTVLVLLGSLFSLDWRFAMLSLLGVRQA